MEESLFVTLSRWLQKRLLTGMTVEKIQLPYPGTCVARTSITVIILLYDITTKQTHLLEAPVDDLGRTHVREGRGGVGSYLICFGHSQVSYAVGSLRSDASSDKTYRADLPGAYTCSLGKETNQTTDYSRQMEKQISLSDIWSPLFSKDGFLITDGQRITDGRVANPV
jgi:hypothetical protein